MVEPTDPLPLQTIITVELEGMLPLIMRLVKQSLTGTADMITDQVNAAIEAFDVGAAVQHETSRCIRETLEGYFRHGPGSRFIHDLVTQTIEEQLHPPEPEPEYNTDPVWEALEALHTTYEQRTLADVDNNSGLTPYVVVDGAIYMAVKRLIVAYETMLLEQEEE